MELEAIILSKLTQEQKSKCHTFTFKWELDIRTYEHKEGNNRHWGLFEGKGWEEGEEQRR